MNGSLLEFQKRIGYTFKNLNNLATALTHSSYANENGCESNERMEFLGDSILNFLVAERLYATGQSEGKMTTRRALIVSREPLALAVERLGAMSLLRLGVGASREERMSVKFKSNIFEALIGAIYVDGKSLKNCADFIFSNLEIDDVKNSVDYKSALQEIVQAHKLGDIYYDVCEVENCSSPQFKAEVFIDNLSYSVGCGGRKKDAEKDAARLAYNILVQRYGK